MRVTNTFREVPRFDAARMLTGALHSLASDPCGAFFVLAAHTFRPTLRFNTARAVSPALNAAAGRLGRVLAFWPIDGIDARPGTTHVGTGHFRAFSGTDNCSSAFTQTPVGGCEEKAIALAACRVEILRARASRWRLRDRGFRASLVILLNTFGPTRGLDATCANNTKSGCTSSRRGWRNSNIWPSTSLVILLDTFWAVLRLNAASCSRAAEHVGASDFRGCWGYSTAFRAPNRVNTVCTFDIGTRLCWTFSRADNGALALAHTFV